MTMSGNQRQHDARRTMHIAAPRRSISIRPAMPVPMRHPPPTCLFVLLLCCTGAAAASAVEAPAFSSAELAKIRSLGPWPPAFRPDPSNRVSGRPLAVELGRRLFDDPRMSPVGYIACVTCHQPDRAFTDNKARAHGLGDLPRNTPTLANLRPQRWYGWGGASDSLWMASVQPMLDAREFDSQPRIVARIYRRDAELAACYRAVFGSAATGDAERIMVNTGKALAAFVETLHTGRTPFDDFRDALARKDSAAMARYPPAAQRGLKHFVGRLGCSECHAGANFSDGAFHQAPRSDVRPDRGRHDDLQKLRSSAFNLLGKYNDAHHDGFADAKTRRQALVDDEAAALRAFRTPSLRNVSVTAPYLHDGSVDALGDALAHRGNFALEPAQREDLQAFLLTLTDRHGERRAPSVAPVRCP